MEIPKIDLKVTESSEVEEWDVLVGSVGFEARSSYVPLTWASKSRLRLASAFDTHKVLSYSENLAVLEKAGYEIEEHGELDIREWLYKRLADVQKPSMEPLCVAVDTSSFSRGRLAQLLLGAIDLATSRPLVLDLAYAPADYSPPPTGDTAIKIFGPVATEFAGWAREQDMATSCVLGLGYEAERAVGALEYLEPIGAWAFTPSGVDARYDASVVLANKTVWDATPPPIRVDYRVDDPMWMFLELESLIFGLRNSTRPVLVPLGPKIFAAACLLVGVIHAPNVAVWRVSGGDSEEPFQRHAKGPIFALRASLAPLQ